MPFGGVKDSVIEEMIEPHMLAIAGL